MATFNAAQLEVLWALHGGSAASAPTAAAIALAESGGCQYTLAGPLDVRPVKECVYRHTTTENSFGLWQINILAHPGLVGVDLFDPDENTRAAVSISGAGATFQAWTTYTNGAYRQFLAQTEATPPGVTPPAAIVPQPISRYPTPRWVPPGTTGPVDANAQPTDGGSNRALAGIGHAVGLDLVLGINQGYENAKRLWKIVR